MRGGPRDIDALHLRAMKKLTPRRALAIAGFVLLVALLVVPAIIWRREIFGVLSSVAELRAWVAAWGPWAPVAFVGVQALQVVVFVIPGEVAQIAGGYLFGAWQGALLSVAGILVGSMIAFSLARLLGKPFVSAVAPPEQVERIERLLMSRGSKIVFFLLFLIPGDRKSVV
jgi:uncharacterized membrane protein YdjX (TVP38/TMEM64 family)